jgi:L-rhamnose mutarotase
MVIGLKADRVADYKRLHAAVWPGVLDAMRRNGWRNFDIYLKEPENL